MPVLNIYRRAFATVWPAVAALVVAWVAYVPRTPAADTAAKGDAPTTWPAGPTVINAGRGGHNTRNLLRRLDRDVLLLRPGLVVLLVGTNDLLNHGNAVAPAEYVKNVRTLVARIRAGGAKVLLLTIPPCYEPFLLRRHPKEFFAGQSPNDKIRAANAALRALAAELRVPVVDVHQLFSAVGNIGEKPESLLRNPANSRSADGVHPTPEGYRLLAVAVWQAIESASLPRRHVVCFGDSITYGAGAPGAGTSKGQTYPAILARLLRKHPRNKPEKSTQNAHSDRERKE